VQAEENTTTKHMEQQTAIEWLVEKITKNHDKDFSSFYKAEIEQAKKMEKEQIKEAHSAGQESAYGFKDKETAGEYYQKTYEK